ncbi:hypothetical protein [uncultured Thiodictyon sp.]|uniref:hypothetical protein n=1 Tax=uncultured Thiodictyon sp. TaxID=1846217 RepID=UPI0025EEBDA2|nr:hypothetical protein [uncultured Thiodictyon sp.]
MGLVISPQVRAKLAQKTPPVTESEILQCFANRSGNYLIDSRENNQTDPPTRWFIAETDYGRKLKIAFIPKDSNVIVKTAYDPNPTEEKIYGRFG